MKKQVKRNLQNKEEIEQEYAQEPEEEEASSDELDIRDKEFVSVPELKVIHFDYDSSDLSKEARDILSANSEYLQKHKNLDFLVEGHCDNRGTVGYNLALGQKRAIAVRKYYISLGIKPKRSGSISYGKERPVCPENTEECWAKNRRAETKVYKKSLEEEIQGEENPGEKSQ